MKDPGKHVCTKRRYCHDTNIDHENKSGNTLIQDLVKPYSKRKIYKYGTNINCESQPGNTLIKDLMKHPRKIMYNFSDDSTIETQNSN